MRGLEERNPRTGRWILYKSQEQHSLDCEKYPFEQVPRRVFLDTNVVNMLVKYSEIVFERQSIPGELDETKAYDLEALMHVFYVGARADWDLVASSKTIEELSSTSSDKLRNELLDYAVGVVDSNSEMAVQARNLGRRILGSSFFDVLPDRDDRELLAHAIGLDCDAFCTSDRRTIVRASCE